MSDLSPIDTASMETVALDRMRIGLNNYVSRNAVIDFREDVDTYLGEYFRAELRSEVLARRLDTRVYSESAHFDEPASTWQMFKRTHASSWWLRWLVERRPVRTVRHTQQVIVRATDRAIYPDARIQLSDQLGRPFLITQMERVR